MKPFTLTRPTTIQQAVQTVAQQPTARFIAGGTNLLDLMKQGVEQPDQLLDINRLALKHITPHGGDLRLGALARNAHTANHPQVRQQYPLLSQAILAGASAQLRNAATNGGNLLQRTRCYYFYDTTTPCNKREPGSGCSAIDGFNRIHAILGTSASCIATNPSDMSVALAALQAVVRVHGINGAERAIPLGDFHRLPADTPQMDTNLQPGELITAIDLPAASTVFANHSHYLKVRDRASYAFALVSVAAAFDFGEASQVGQRHTKPERTIRQVRITLGGVAHKPWRSVEAETVLVGGPATEAAFSRAADLMLQSARGYRHNTFKIELAKRAIVQALTQAAQGTG